MKRALVAVSLVSCAYGAWLALHLPVNDLVRVALWMVGVLLVHDIVFAPLVHLVGRLLRHLPVGFLAPAQAYLIVVGTTLLATVPTWLALGRTPLEESLLPRSYGDTVVSLLAAGAVVAFVVGILRRRSLRKGVEQS